MINRRDALVGGVGAGLALAAPAVAQAPVNAPVLAAFRNTGRLAIAERGRETVLTATPAERAQIEQFFASCSA